MIMEAVNTYFSPELEGAFLTGFCPLPFFLLSAFAAASFAPNFFLISALAAAALFALSNFF